MARRINLYSENFEKHVCNARREGEWFIYECPLCDYVRRWNPSTDELYLINEGDLGTLHSGMYQPVGAQLEKYSPN